MKIIQTYQCGVCGQIFGTVIDCLHCEKQPVTKDTGVQIGDRVKILSGDNAGEFGTVSRRIVVQQDWGHYQWKRYWHTLAIEVRCDSGGNRFLTFDAYSLA